MFLKKLWLFLFVVSLFSACCITYYAGCENFLSICNSSSTYTVSCSTETNKDLRTYLELTTLGNIDGLTYMNQQSNSVSVEIDNADKGKIVALIFNLCITISLLCFLLYQNSTSKFESRNLKNPTSLRDYSLIVTGIPKDYNRDINIDLRNLFIKYCGLSENMHRINDSNSGIIEVVPIYNYNSILQNQMKINKIHHKIKDLKFAQLHSGKSFEKEIAKLLNNEEKAEGKQQKLFDKLIGSLQCKEAIVVFNELTSKQKCITAYTKSICSRSKNIPDELKLNNEYPIRVKEAPETFEIQLENYSYPQWKRCFYIILIWILIAAICSVALVFPINKLNNNFSKFPYNNDCVSYDFSKTTVSTYTSTTGYSKTEASCYCRYNGWSRVMNDGDGNINLKGIKSLCADWISDHDNIYYSLAYCTVLMVVVNFVITYGFKILFNQRLLRFKYLTSRDSLVSYSVFIYVCWFLGIMPSLCFDSSMKEMQRLWYLRAGVLHMLYFFLIIFVSLFERLSVVLIHKIKILCKKKTCHIQKDLNKLIAGIELDYSHKIGRIMGHLFVIFYLGSGTPLLYCLFCVHIFIFCAFEKLMIVKFYKRMKLKSIYIRHFIVQSLCAVFIACLFKTIHILGSEDIFPTTTEIKSGIYSGKTVTYYSPNSRNYGDKMVLSTGIPFTILILSFAVLYSLLWIIHKKCLVFKPFKCFAFADTYINIKQKVTEIKKSFKCSKKALKHLKNDQNSNIKIEDIQFDYKSAFYHPSTYKFYKRAEYKTSLKTINVVLEQRKKLEHNVAPDHEGIEILKKLETLKECEDATARRLKESENLYQENIYYDGVRLKHPNGQHIEESKDEISVIR